MPISTRSGSIRFRFVTLFVVGPLMAVAMLLLALPTAARADVIVSTAVTGPVNGDGGTFTVTETGAITGTINGIEAGTGGTAITALGVAGSVNVTFYGVNMGSGATIDTFTNTGTIEGNRAVNMVGLNTINSIVNSGTLKGTSDGIQLNSTNTIGSIVNEAGGLIEGTTDSGIDGGGAGNFTSIDNAGTIAGTYGVYAGGGDIGTFINRSTGVVRGTGFYGLYTRGALTSFTNEAGGLIESETTEAVRLRGDGVGTFTNAGTIQADSSNDVAALAVQDTITTLTNSGTISGRYGIYTDEAEITITTLTNEATGLIAGTTHGFWVNEYVDVDLTNSGRITGGENGVYAYYGIDSVTNTSGGVISGTSGAGVHIEDESGTVTNQAGGLIESANSSGVFVGNYSGAKLQTLSNAGTIEGATAGVQMENFGTIKKLTNSGTIAYSGTGTGPAVLVGTGGVLGDVDGLLGAAIESTGAGALLDGTIVNQGNIWYGFTIENQNVVVSAAGGEEDGTFTNGLLNVVDGDLTFLDGRTLLEADVAVDGGTGTVFNEGVLAFADERDFTGAFFQSSGGTLSSLITGESTYGSIAISGAATFGGILDLDLLGAFELAEGQTFDLFTFDSRTGGFSGLSVDGTALTSAGTGQWTYGTLTLQEQWTGTSMSIAAVPEPSTSALALAGLACGGYLMRRRKRA